MNSSRGEIMRYAGICLLTLLILAPVSSPAAGVKLVHQASDYGDEKEGGIKYPEGVACSDRNQVVLADTGNGRLLRYSAKDLLSREGGGIKLPQLPFPTRVQFTTAGDILALDGKLRRIGRVNSAGAFAGYVEPRGVPAPTIVPRSFKLDAGDNLYLLDIAGDRVVVLDPAGNFRRQIPLPGGAGFFADLTVDAQESVLVLDSINARLHVAAKDASGFTPLTPPLHDYMDFPVSMSLDGQGKIFLLDQNGSALIILGMDGSFQGRQLNYGVKNAFLNYPSQLCISRAGDIFIADRDNNRLQQFRINR